MIDFIFAMIAIAATSNPSDPHQSQTAQAEPQLEAPAASSVVIGEGVTIGGATIIEGTPVDTADGLQLELAVVPDGVVAEPQIPTGKFTTATEVKPILTATKANWVGLRDYGGNDLVYVTHLWAWRCGLSGMALSINDGPMKDIPLPECHLEYASPNAILEGDGLPYLTYPQGSVERITVQIVYDDLSQDTATFSGSQIRIP
ncbi:hypothetical protein [Sulfitobacter sp.]|jgi:hypothetical protein|uniref:hypothetical protein n=1 Tax=Sulfitobacter sp. TaxID=1903071 RepID=UPI0030010AF8